MSDNKELIQKLSTIVAKQQKIITKLAQMLPAEPTGGASLVDVSLDLQSKLNMIPGARGYKVESAELGTQSGALRAHIRVPMTDVNFHQVSESLRRSLSGATLKSNDGKSVQVTSEPQDINLTALKG